MQPVNHDKTFNPDELDQPKYQGADQQDYIICTTPRVGSNLLCELLRRNNFGIPMEYFHTRKHLPILAHRYHVLAEYYEPILFDFVMDDLIENNQFSYANYITALKQHRTTNNGLFGFKAHWGQFKRLTQEANVHTSFTNIKFIHLQRRDKIAQAISMHKAAASKQWNSNQRQKGQLKYSDEHISKCLYIAQNSNANWQNWFQSSQISPLNIFFEDLLNNTEATFNQVAAHITNEKYVSTLTLDTDLSKGNLKSQHDSTNTLWKEKFLAKHPDQNG